VPFFLKSGSLNLLEPSGPVQTCNGIDLPFLVVLCYSSLVVFGFSRNDFNSCAIFNFILLGKGRGRGCTGFWWENLRERDHWGDPDVDGRIILRWIFRKWEEVVETG